MEPAGWSRLSSIGVWLPAGSARPKRSPNRRPRWARMYTFLAVVRSTEPNSRPVQPAARAAASSRFIAACAARRWASVSAAFSSRRTRTREPTRSVGTTPAATDKCSHGAHLGSGTRPFDAVPGRSQPRPACSAAVAPARPLAALPCHSRGEHIRAFGEVAAVRMRKERPECAAVVRPALLVADDVAAALGDRGVLVVERGRDSDPHRRCVSGPRSSR